MESVLDGRSGHSTDSQVSFKKSLFSLQLGANINDRLRTFSQLVFGLKSRFVDPNSADRTNSGTALETDFRHDSGQSSMMRRI